MTFLILLYVVGSVVAGLAVSFAGGGGLPVAVTTRDPGTPGLSTAEFKFECWKLDHPEAVEDPIGYYMRHQYDHLDNMEGLK